MIPGRRNCEKITDFGRQRFCLPARSQPRPAIIPPVFRSVVHQQLHNKAFYDDQERIRNQGEHLHESEHRNGGKLVIKVTKVMWHAARREIRRKHREWFGHPKRHHYYED